MHVVYRHSATASTCDDYLVTIVAMISATDSIVLKLCSDFNSCLYSRFNDVYIATSLLWPEWHDGPYLGSEGRQRGRSGCALACKGES